MKAAVLHANEDIRYEEFPTPETLPGTVKVRVRATGICGSDVPRVLHHGAHFYPVVLGHEFAGDVVEVGEGVETLQVGDTVSGAPLLPCMKCADCQQGNYSLCKHYSFIGSRQQGSFADYVVLPERNAVKYDPSIPYEQAAMFEPSTVAAGMWLCSAAAPSASSHCNGRKFSEAAAWWPSTSTRAVWLWPGAWERMRRSTRRKRASWSAPRT